MEHQKQTNVEMFQIGSKQQKTYADSQQIQNPVGTQILDPSMPSDLNFGKPSQMQIQPSQQNIPFSKKTHIYNPQINSYSVKGQPVIKIQPQLHPGSIIKNSIPTYIVKCFTEQKSQGIKKIWETIIGYVKRQLYFADGYIFLLELQNDGYFVHACWNIANIFKIFLDTEQNKIRIVFKQQKNQLITKDFKVSEIAPIFQKLCEQIQKIGLKINC